MEKLFLAIYLLFNIAVIAQSEQLLLLVDKAAYDAAEEASAHSVYLDDTSATKIWVEADAGWYGEVDGEVTVLYNKNKAKTVSTTYSSDFSAGVDGWARAAGDETSAVTQVGSNLNLAVTVAGTNAARPFLYRSITLTNGTLYRVTATYTINSGTVSIPSTNLFGTLINDVETLTATSGTLTYTGVSNGNVTVYFYFDGTNTFDITFSQITVDVLDHEQLVQTSYASRATYNTGAFVFDGGSSRFVNLADEWPTFTELTVYMVVRQDTWTSSDTFLDGRGTSDFAIKQYNATPGLQLYAGTNGAANNDLVLDTWGLITVVASNTTYTFQVNNNATTGSSDPGTIDARGFSLGAQYGGSGGADIDVKALIVREGNDSSEVQAIIKNYLNTKYSIY